MELINYMLMIILFIVNKKKSKYPSIVLQCTTSNDKAKLMNCGGGGQHKLPTNPGTHFYNDNNSNFLPLGKNWKYIQDFY